MQSSTLQDACNQQANHKLRPFSIRPQVQRLQIQGRPACLILPSPDQDLSMQKMATLIVPYAKPVPINGFDFNYFQLIADEEHIRQIANSLRFATTK
jgi:hypothetical protein